jgi:hypothetical protein
MTSYSSTGFNPENNRQNPLLCRVFCINKRATIVDKNLDIKIIMQHRRVGETKALLTDEEHFYTFQLAHPITIKCDSSSDDDVDDENNNNDGADNEGAEVDDNHSSCCSSSPPSGDICCDKGTRIVIDPISTVVMVSSAKKKMMMMKVRGQQQGEKKEEEEEKGSDGRDRSQKSRSMDSEMIHDTKSYKDRALWTNELVS